MSPMNGASIPRRNLMDRVTCTGCGKTAAAEKVKRDGWTPIEIGGRIVGANCAECAEGGQG